MLGLRKKKHLSDAATKHHQAYRLVSVCTTGWFFCNPHFDFTLAKGVKETYGRDGT